MFCVIRHGKTDWNALFKLQGRTDIPLNEEGRKMAQKAAEEYRDVHFDVCYCSPLIRARETAEILLKDRNIPIIYDDRLLEMKFGKYEGTQNCYLLEDCPVKILFTDPANYKGVEDGETLEELFERTGSFIKEVVEPLMQEGKDLLVVGHGAMNSSIICQVRNKSFGELWSEPIENCKLKVLIE